MSSKIKSVLIWSTVILLVLIFNFTTPPSIYGADETVDQCCTPGDAWETVSGHSDISQTFTPTQNRLSRVGVWLDGDGDGTVYLRIIDSDGTVGSAFRSEPSDYSLIYFDFDDLVIEPGDSNYRIKLTTGPDNTSLKWHRSGTGETSCCDSGYALLDGETKDYDWGFATYGWTYTPPEDDSGGSSDQSDNDSSQSDSTADDGSTVGTNEAPNENTDENIGAPSELSVSDVPDDQGGQLKLNWKASTTSAIDGYKVFRSKEKARTFKNIAQTEKDITSYKDVEVIPEQDYYYFVRAYRGEEESPSSETVKAASLDNLAPETPTNFQVLNNTDRYVKLSWDTNEGEDLEKYLLLVEDPAKERDSRQILRVDIDAKSTDYRLVYKDFSEIEPGNDYQFYLQAKDTSDNYSQKAGPVQANSEAQELAASRTLMWYISLGILSLLVAVLISLLYRMRREDKKKAKPSNLTRSTSKEE